MPQNINYSMTHPNVKQNVSTTCLKQNWRDILAAMVKADGNILECK